MKRTETKNFSVPLLYPFVMRSESDSLVLGSRLTQQAGLVPFHFLTTDQEK